MVKEIIVGVSMSDKGEDFIEAGASGFDSKRYHVLLPDGAIPFMVDPHANPGLFKFISIYIWWYMEKKE